MINPGFLGATRRLGDGDYEVSLRASGEVIGRVRRTTPAYASFTARWEALDPAGGRAASGATSRANAVVHLINNASARRLANDEEASRG